MKRNAYLVSILALLILGAIVLGGFLPRWGRQRDLLAASHDEQRRLPAVTVVRVARAASAATLTLPGNVQAITDTPIYARADGYLRKRYVDIGDVVRAGQLLAELDTPELDQQLSQARANFAQSQAALKQAEASLVQGRANLTLAKTTLGRWKKLVQEGVVSHQDADEKQADFEARDAGVAAMESSVNAMRASVSANQANLQRLEELKSFDRITAPFDGGITARNVEVGALITAGSGGAGRELFHIGQSDRLRIFVDVPQSFVPSIHVGASADLTVAERPNQIFLAQVVRTSNALNASSRTLLVELQLANPRHFLLAGMYAQVAFHLSQTMRPVLIPEDALVVRADGPQVAVAGPDHRVHYHHLALGRDHGAQVEVTAGLEEGDLVIVNPTDQVRENSEVEIHKFQ